MGQPITVIEKPGERNDIVRFELNRSLTGMGHERYRADQEILGDRPPDELARRLFAHGGVEAVHIYSNVVTVDLAPGAKSDEPGRVIDTAVMSSSCPKRRATSAMSCAESMVSWRRRSILGSDCGSVMGLSMPEPGAVR